MADMHQDMEGGFFQALFDFSFSRFVTLKIVRVLYGIGLVLCFVFTIAAIAGGFAAGAGTGIFVLLFSPLLLILYVIGLRVWLELVIVIFRIAQDTRILAQRGGEGTRVGPPDDSPGEGRM